MAVGLLISLPEGLEAFLIIAVLAACFHHAGQLTARVAVFAAASLAIIFTILSTSSGLVPVNERSLVLIDVVTAVIGLIVVSWLIDRVRQRAWPSESGRTGRSMPLGAVGSTVVTVLAFLIVFRELIETVVFSSEISASAGGGDILPGIIIGLALGSGLAALCYWLLVSAAADSFWEIGALALMFGAAALGVHLFTALSELSLLPPTMSRVVWDMNWLAPQNGLLGRFLHAFTGYDATPSGSSVFFYLSYLLLFGLRLAVAQRRAWSGGTLGFAGDEVVEETV